MTIADRSEAGIEPRRSALKFFFLALRRPAGLGAVVPSSGRLARAIAREIPAQAPGGVVVELGGGTGVVTQALLDSGVAENELVVIEREQELFEILCARFPRVRVIKADARFLQAALAELGIAQVRAVASGLPLLNMPERVREEIVRQSFAVLEPGGAFLQFTYGPASPVPGRLVESLGLHAKRARWVPFNLPPATIWRYRQRAAA